jgi:hypothetical protein
MPPQLSLSKACRTCFDSSSVQRGEGYFRQGQIQFRKFDGKIAVFVAQGSRPGGYEVRVDSEKIADRQLSVYCECPHYDDGFLCKHVWGAILSIENSPVASRFLVFGKVKVVHESDHEDTDEDDENEDDRYGRGYEEEIRESRKAATADWGSLLDLVLSADRVKELRDSSVAFGDELIYVLDSQETIRSSRGLHIRLWKRGRGRIDRLREDDRSLHLFKNPIDRELLSLLLGNPPGKKLERNMSEPIVPFDAAETVLKRMCSTGRLFGSLSEPGKSLVIEGPALYWDEEPWDFKFHVVAADSTHYQLGGLFERGETRFGLDRLLCVISPDLLIFSDRVAKLGRRDVFGAIAFLRKTPQIRVPKEEGMALVRKLLESKNSPEVLLPEELRWDEIPGVPVVRLRISWRKSYSRSTYPRPVGDRLTYDLSFQYGAIWTDAKDARDRVIDVSARHFILRDRNVEAQCARELETLLSGD